MDGANTPSAADEEGQRGRGPGEEEDLGKEDLGSAASGCCRGRGRGRRDRPCPLRPRPLGSCSRIPPPPQQLEAGGIGSDPSPQDGALGSGIRAPRASRGKAGLKHQGVTQQKATSSSSCSPRPRLLLPCPPTPPWIQCSQWSECCRPREQKESLSSLCQDVMGLVLHQHLHAPHVRAPELQAILHPLDLLQV